MAKAEPVGVKPIEDEDQWAAMMELSVKQLVVLDCHQDWCGPCMTLEPTFRRVMNSTDKCDLRCSFQSANIGKFSEKITNIIGGEPKRDLAEHGCMPIVLLVKDNACVTSIDGANAPALLEAIKINLPPPPEDEEDPDA